MLIVSSIPVTIISLPGVKSFAQVKKKKIDVRALLGAPGVRCSKREDFPLAHEIKS